MTLSRLFLSDEASPQVFERGEAMYKLGRIRSLVKQNGLFLGEIQGGLIYRQTLDFQHDPPTLTCSCPYSGPGICKHLVAAGLAILDKAFQAKIQSSSPKDRKQAPGPAYEDIDRLSRELSQISAHSGESKHQGLSSIQHRFESSIASQNYPDALRISLALYENNQEGADPSLQTADADARQTLQIALADAFITYPENLLMLDLIFKRWSRYEHGFKLSGEKPFQLPPLFGLLKCLAFDQVSSRQLDTRLQGYQLFGEEYAGLREHIARHT